jgi:transcriptional regulator with XRE-family HTH domain
MDSNKLLGEFLRARREVTTPVQVGLLHSGPRRTPGLRREEVAMLAGVSTDYYIRLEQGRERRPSGQVLAALARVLRLEDDATDYLYDLAHPWTRPSPRPTRRMEQVSPGLLRLLRSWDHTPAFVMGRWLDVLAANRLAEALYERLTYKDNCMRMFFLSPEAQDFYPDWEHDAASKTAQLRAAVGADPDDPVLPQLVEELSAHSEVFRSMWARHDVGGRIQEIKRFRHHEVGELTLGWEVLAVNGAPGQQLVILAAEPGSPSEHALATLARAHAHDPAPSRIEPSPSPLSGPGGALTRHQDPGEPARRRKAG